ncbi:MAG: GNAT family N-acetyltransferase [Anaerocolumna sp.]
MSICTCNQLKKKQVKDIHTLISICNTYEGLSKNPILENDNLYEELSCYYLYYEKEILVSVLIIDQFSYTEAEITGYTLPKFRRQGYFYKLLEEAMDELAYFEIYRILLVVDSKSMSGTGCAKALSEYSYSEYMLIHELVKHDKEKINFDICFREVSMLLELQEEVVKELELSGSLEVAEAAMESKDNICLAAYLNEHCVGICNLSLTSDKAYLFGLYVLENHRKQGIGYAFVQYLIHMAITYGKETLTLQVGDNPKALHLYLKSDFQVLEQLDYYAMDIEVET